MSQPTKETKERFYEIIFGHDTTEGRIFDIFLIIAIFLSILVVCLDSVAYWGQRYGTYFLVFDWILTFLFLVEYLVRVYCSPNRKKYIFSYLGFIDLVSILPTFISPLFAGAQSMIVVRSLRLLRVFRILKLAHLDSEGMTILKALKASRYKIFVFICSVLILVVILGTLMYIVEGPATGFDSIPRGMYWAIVTLTTVGYGDITPGSALGQTLSAIVMILGYAIIAVPTGIVTSAMSRQKPTIIELSSTSKVENKTLKENCEICSTDMHFPKARYCWNCGKGRNRKS